MNNRPIIRTYSSPGHDRITLVLFGEEIHMSTDDVAIACDLPFGTPRSDVAVVMLHNFLTVISCKRKKVETL